MQPTTDNSPMNWNDLWEPHNKERWAKKATARINCTKEDASSECIKNKPADWDMWQPSRKR